MNKGYEVIWFDEFDDKNRYIIVEAHETYFMYKWPETKVPNDGKYFTLNKEYYVCVKNGQIHNATGPAILCPCGLDSFNPGKKVEHYCLYGKIVSKKAWISWVKNSPYWEEAKINILGREY